MTPGEQKLIQGVLRYLDGELSEEEERQLARQLKADPEARARFAELAVFNSGITTALEEFSVPAGRAARSRGAPWIRRFLPLAAAATILAAAGVWWMNEGRVSRLRGAAAWQASVKGGVVAKVEKVSGFSVQCSGKEEKQLKAGDEVRGGARIETGKNGTVTLAYAGEDTTVEVGQVSGVRCQVSERGGKSLFLDKGKLAAVVAKQPEGKPFVVETPHARLTVLGTQFSVQVSLLRPEGYGGQAGFRFREDGETEHSAIPSTRLEVHEGTVRMTRLADGQSVNVLTGQCATAAPGAELVSRPIASTRIGSAETVFSREFESFHTDEWAPNELVRLPEAGGEVTAIVSKPFVGGTSSWKPDVYIELCGRGPAGEARALYTIPAGLEIRMRIRSDRPGKWYFTQQPADCRSNEEGLATAFLDVTPEWRDVVLRGGDLVPYRRPGVYTPDMVAGMRIKGFAVYGFGVGRLYVDRFEVVSVKGGGKN